MVTTLTAPRPAPRSFGHVDTWVFDLDNTLYPHHVNLWQQVDVRIRDYIADFLKIGHEEAFRLQKDYYKRYGTSMRGLMTEHGMKPDDFLDFVHQVDHSPLEPNPPLGVAIEKLHGRKLILTNGTRSHADAVLARLGLDRHFEDVFDIVAGELEPKPSPVVYDRFLKAHGVNAERAAMFEDLARNLAVPHRLGMTTVLVVPENTREVFREDWELEGRDEPHVDHVTDNLVAFLGIHRREALRKPMRNQQKLSVAIVGAGIGGLAVAAALRKYFIEPVIYEQADAFARVGAGIQQSPNAVKVHRWLGIEERTRGGRVAPETSLNRDALSGKVTNDHPLGREVEARYGAPYLTMHRGDLHDALASVVPAQSIRLGKKLTQIRERGARVELAFADGSEAEADAVIGADGVHSLARDHVAGPEQARFTGRLAYRTTFPVSLLSGVDIGLSRTKWWGKDRHIVIYFVTAKRDEVYFTTSQPEKADWMTKEFWSMTGDLAEMRAAFASFHSEVQRVLAAAPQVHKWGIYERAPLPAWSRETSRCWATPAIR